jgi:hypothetical protein
MADLLGATNHVPGYERNTISNSSQLSPSSTQVQNIPTPTRVNRPDSRTDRQDNGSQNDLGQIQYDSNFQTFFQRLKEADGLSEVMTKLLAGREGTVVLSGMSDGISAELAQVMEMLRMDPEQMKQFLTEQAQAGSRFQGPLFSLLRKAYSSASSDAVQTDILQFLKSYLDHSSTSHIEGNILRDLGKMADAMPDSWASKLRDMISQLKNGIAAGDRQGNISLMQRSVIPLMSDYVDATHDMGLPRALLSMLTLNLARYENGSTENLLENFHQLSGYGTLKGTLGKIDDETLLKQLERNQWDPSTSANQFADHLVSAAARALRGEGSAETQQIMQQLVNAMLINESVYMPVNHFLIPMEMNGKKLFSEMWVDPDDQKSGSGGQDGTMKFLFKMDVETLGLFDVVLTCRDRDVDLRIACPEKVSSFSKEIESAMSDILTRNGFNSANITVRKMERPVTLTEVFPKIFEGKNSVNVKV